ncbi:uncharacterized protein BO96DRAFT_121354 [Aspergillus niger CBS 101883]|uniref:uncharacterized protein n=1 Tax=Aspergillus lacticoffeatus (strain CBS 101883) TaxID=1450533 RepID=UPI000D7FFECD|nr:uncharacterized protein BO96DRAFT_121354 [Aspergillus niger CBS 101883]PYH53890.1 hypothetical protein BO96DRAFT_121354 [Aspergillus niger CBS 101883]
MLFMYCTNKKFTAALICKRVAVYNFPTKALAVGRENNCCVFQGQWSFETDCTSEGDWRIAPRLVSVYVCCLQLEVYHMHRSYP